VSVLMDVNQEVLSTLTVPMWFDGTVTDVSTREDIVVSVFPVTQRQITVTFDAGGGLMLIDGMNWVYNDRPWNWRKVIRALPPDEDKQVLKKQVETLTAGRLQERCMLIKSSVCDTV
jgi:hypothetical protein